MRSIVMKLMGVIGLVLVATGSQASFSYYEFHDSTNLSFETVKQIIEENEFTTMEETLEYLKVYYPEFFANYILMYKSRSLQQASFENPRAILMDLSAQFVFSFNGNKDQRGFNKLEIMQFRDDENRFEFREISFFENGAKPSFSEANPRKCMACHQSAERRVNDPRPNWEPYNTWPGAYGSTNGDLRVSTHDRNELTKRGGEAHLITDAEQEESKIAEFFGQVQPEHPRYKYLDKNSYDVHLTTKFTQFTSNLNFRRVVRIITEEWAEAYPYLEYAFLSLVKCRKITIGKDNLIWALEQLPDGSVAADELRKRKLKTDVELRMQARANLGQWAPGFEEEDVAAEVERLRERDRAQYDGSPSVTISAGIELIFEPLGIDTSDWSMDFRTDGHLAFRERFGTPSNTRRTLFDAFALLLGRDKLMNAPSCDQMMNLASEGYSQFRQKALFAELQRKKSLRTQRDASWLMGRCTRCHTDDDPEIPYIDFDDREGLVGILNLPSKLNPQRTLMEDIRYRMSDMATEDERMPMGPIVDRSTRHDLVEYLELLSGLEGIEGELPPVTE